MRSCCAVRSATVRGEKEAVVVVGGEMGVLRVWDVGVWDDGEGSVDVGGGGRGGGVSVDCLAARPMGEREGMVAVGCDDGVVRFVGMRMGRGKGKGEGEDEGA